MTEPATKNPELVNLADPRPYEVLEASVAVVTAIILASIARGEGVYINAVEGLATPVVIDNANAIYYYIPKFPPGFDTEDLADLMLTMARGEHFVEAGSPLLEGPASVAMFRESRRHRTLSYELLENFLENAVGLAHEKPQEPSVS